jgi:hypothetical protein
LEAVLSWSAAMRFRLLGLRGSGAAHAPRLKALLAEHFNRQTTPVDA